MSKIKVLQNKAVRIISGKQYFQIFGETPGPLPSADPLYKELMFLDFNDIYNFSIAKFIYLTLCGKSPSLFHNWFKYTHEVHSHATRSSVIISQENQDDPGTEISTYTLYTRKSNLQNYGRKMIKVSGPLVWNKLAFDIQDAVSIATFKENLKTFYIGQYADS